MKKLLLFVFALSMVFFSACNKEDLGKSNITVPPLSTDPLDIWIREHYTTPYNINVHYKWEVDGKDPAYALVPPHKDFVEPFLRVVYKIWLRPYTRVSPMGETFMKLYSARDLTLVGSGEWQRGGESVLLGLASGGYKITLYTVNDFDLVRGIHKDTLTRFFRTMHHEFGHILNQRKPYDPNFKTITGGYNPDWTSTTNEQVREKGFITAYGSSADTEEFVELYSYYVANTEAEWNAILNAISNEKGREYIKEKLEKVKSYMKVTYGFDMDLMRAEVTAAIAEVAAGNLD